MYDFANILFAGPCNRRCPFCIGKQLPDHVNVNNLNQFPPPGIEKLIEMVNREKIRQIIFTGTISDPQLYRHESRLIEMLRERLHPEAQFSVHTNGALALKKMEIFNQYDRASLSFPTFSPDTYEKMTGSRSVPDLQAILREATIPVKISCVVNEHNAGEIDFFLEECHGVGVGRVVIRKLFGDSTHASSLQWNILKNLPVVKRFRNNPVMDYRGMEVTYWDFDTSECQSINLYPDGTLGTSYLLTRAPEICRERKVHELRYMDRRVT